MRTFEKEGNRYKPDIEFNRLPAQKASTAGDVSAGWKVFTGPVWKLPGLTVSYMD